MTPPTPADPDAAIDVDQWFLTTQELADWLRISRFSVYRYIAQGLPHYRIGSHHRFKPAEVEAWMKQCAVVILDRKPSLNSKHPNAYPRTPTHTMTIEETTAKLKELMQ